MTYSSSSPLLARLSSGGAQPSSSSSWEQNQGQPPSQSPPTRARGAGARPIPMNKSNLYVKNIQFGRFTSESCFAVAWERRGKGRDALYVDAAKGRRGASLQVRMWPSDAHPSSIRVVVEAITITRIISGGCSLFLHLSRPPRLEVVDDSTYKSRQVPCLDDEHRQTSTFACTTLRIELASEELRSEAIRRGISFLPRVVASRISVQMDLPLFQEGTIWSVENWMARLDVRVAFQLDALVKIGVLDYQQVNFLADAVVEIVRGQGVAEAERILVLFAAKLVHRWKELEGGDKEDGAEVGGRQKKLAGRTRGHDESVSDDNTAVVNTLLGDLAAKPPPPSFYTIDQLLGLLCEAAADEAASRSPFARLDQAVLARHVTITPTRVLLHGPSYDEGNALLRQFGAPQHFLRVTVQQEDRGRLGTRDEDLINDYLAPLFAKGIVVAGRRFDFLAFSSSQLRAHSCFFVEPFEKDGTLVTAHVIRSSLGDFTALARTPAKWMARIGQALTSSRSSIELQPEYVKKIPDITSASGLVHSDGVGLISPEMAAEVVAVGGGVRAGERAPTCWQFRLGGAKGMLQVDPTLTGKVIALRPSQIKFNVHSSLALAIVGSHTFRPALPAYLNRPLVALLADLGAPSGAFLKLQKKAVEELQTEGSLAGRAGLLFKYNVGVGGGIKFAEMLETLAATKGMEKVACGNPFMQRCLGISRSFILRDIKYKARIPLPTGCYNLVGVLDHTGFLAEGEVYACIETRTGRTYLEGTLAVSRSPTMAPGDVQLVTGVGKIPQGSAMAARSIRALRNCLVFSSKGDRSLPSKLSGGDLDGDLYLILNKASGLLPKPHRIAQPASYAPPPIQPLDYDCSIAEGRNFLFEYIKHDTVSIVATRHLMLGDLDPVGAFSDDCVRLAELHSDAVDFNKSGRPVPADAIPKAPKDSALWPDFLRAEGYRSPKVLGLLYRAMDDDEQDPIDTFLSSCISLDPYHALTNAFLAQSHPSLPGGRLARAPSPFLVDHFASFITPVSRELQKLRQLVPTTRGLSEEELYMGVFLDSRAKQIRADADACARLRERTGELFGLLRREIVGDAQGSAAGVVERVWAAWWAALGAEKDAEVGVRCFGMIVLSLLVEWLGKLEATVVIELD